jgi:RNA polymerase sigma-70 factor (ECF subfamily)
MQVERPPRPDKDELAREAALVARSLADPDAFGELYDRYVLRVYRFAFRRLGSHAEAEEITAQTFHRAFEALGRFEWRGVPFGAWLFRIAHNAVIDRRRAGAAPVSLDGIGEDGFEPPDAGAVTPEEALLAQEELGAAWEAVARLPALQRQAVTLRFGRDLSHAEVGAIIGRSEAATKQLVYRAIKTLRELLEVQ